MKQFTSKLLVLLIAISSLVGCKAIYPNKYDPDTTRITDQIPSNEAIDEIIEPYKAELDAQMNRPIGVFAHEMNKYTPECELGNFMCDATQEFYNAMQGVNVVDFTIMNQGGIRTNSIPAGEVRVETMFELMPFENEVVTLEITGDQVMEIFEVVAKSNGAWPLSKTVQLTVEGKKVKQLKIKGEDVQPTKTYLVVTTDYIANGGSNMKPMKTMKHTLTNVKLRDVLIDYCDWKTELGEEIAAPVTGRVKVIGEPQTETK